MAQPTVETDRKYLMWPRLTTDFRHTSSHCWTAWTGRLSGTFYVKLHGINGSAHGIRMAAGADAGKRLRSCCHGYGCHNRQYRRGLHHLAGWALRRRLAHLPFLKVSQSQRQRAEAWYRRYGSASLLFSWLPVIGDPLCMVGGLLKIRFSLFLVLAGSGKLLRYALLAWATMGISG